MGCSKNNPVARKLWGGLDFIPSQDFHFPLGSCWLMARNKSFDYHSKIFKVDNHRTIDIPTDLSRMVVVHINHNQEKMAYQKRNLYLAFSIMLALMLFPIVSATITTSPTNVFLNPSTTSQLIEFTKDVNDSTNTLSLSLSTGIASVTQLNFNTVNFPSERFVTISVKSGAVGGSYSGTIDWSGGSLPVSVFVESQANTTINSDITVFPTSKITTVQQGKEKTQNILVSVPSNYPRSITIEAIDFNPGTETITFGDLNLGQIAPGNSINIPIVFSGVDAQTGTYQTDLRFSAKDSAGNVPLPTVSLTLQVTQGINPVTDSTFNTAPTCSLSNTQLSLNQTYSFTCSNTQANLDIDIRPDGWFIGTKQETASGLYRYDFTPVKYGNWEFHADFKVNGAPIFAPYNEDVRVTSAGSVIPGTVLRFDFTPKLENAVGGENISILIVDNKTGSLVSNPRLFINALELTPTGLNLDTFVYNFESQKDYELRGVANGYDNLIQTININPEPITITVTPATGTTGTQFNISTNPSNATLYINGVEQSNPFLGQLPAGVIPIEARKSGHTTAQINVTISGTITANPSGGEILKKGEDITITLSESINYTIYHQEKLDSIESEEYLSGAGSVITFKPDKSGVYVIEDSDGKHIATFSTKPFSWKNKLLWIPYWAWLIIGILLIIVVVVIVYFKSQGSAEDDGEGLNYQVGPD